jgi:hypothetical protein
MIPDVSQATRQSELAGSFSGAQLVVDPKTGFLEFRPDISAALKTQGKNLPVGAGGACGFTAEKKVKFISLFRRCWPNMTKAALKVGISRWTVKNHMRVDEAFADAVQAVVEEAIDGIEETMQRHGKKQKNYLDRVTLARAYRPEVFDPAKRLIIERGASLTPDEARSRLSRAQGAIDVEVVTAQFPAIPANTGTPDQVVEKSV